MSNFSFDTFPLTKRIGIVNPVANLDARYGPWPTYNDALTAFSPLIREKGLTVAVSGVEGVVEYWYKNGITNSDLVLKSSDITEADILPTVTNYLSTNSVLISSLSVKGPILSGNNVELSNIFSNTKYFFNDNFPSDKTQRYIYYGNGYQGIGELFGDDVAFDLNAPWTKWFVNLGNGPISGNNYDDGYQIYVYPNEIKKIHYNGTSYQILENYYLSNSQQWDSIYTTVQSNSANWNFGYNVGTFVQANSATWEESAEILPTVTNYLSTNSVLISSLNVSNNITVVGSISSNNLVYSANNSVQIKTLTQNENTLSANAFGIFFKTVSSDNTFVYAGFNPGQTITLYLSANHGTVKRHTLPSPTYLSNASESNEIYTYEGYITKTTIQRIGNEYYGISNIIKRDIGQNIEAIGRILLDQTSDYLLQENLDRLLLETN